MFVSVTPDCVLVVDGERSVGVDSHQKESRIRLLLVSSSVVCATSLKPDFSRFCVPCTYINHVTLVSAGEVGDDRRFTEKRELGHIAGHVEFRRVDLVCVVDLDHAVLC